MLLLPGVELNVVGEAVEAFCLFLEMTIKQEGHALDTLQQFGDGIVSLITVISNQH